MLRSGKFFQQFIELKNSLIFGCILKVLAFTPDDFEKYYYEPEEFLHTLLQIIDLDTSALLQKKKRAIVEKQKKQNETVDKINHLEYNEEDDE